jgi:hypothetical protein
MPMFKCTYVPAGKNSRVLRCEAKDSEDARKIAAHNFHTAVNESQLEVVEVPTESTKPDDSSM